MLKQLCLCLSAALLSPVLRAQLDAHTISLKAWTKTEGGAGGQLVYVSNLNNAGPGSLRAALETEGARIVVFEVGGVIDLDGKQMQIKHPHITVAGQTAPHPGITLIKGGINIMTHDVIVQHLMIRPGEYGRPKRSGGDHDGISTFGGA
ncbi:MAG: hypothetical protein RLZZ502_1403, partial [Pseudomonadota bacterium]